MQWRDTTGNVLHVQEDVDKVRLYMCLCTVLAREGGGEGERELKCLMSSSHMHRMVQYCHDEAARFVHILAGHHSGRTYLVEDDFLCLVQVQ